MESDLMYTTSTNTELSSAAVGAIIFVYFLVFIVVYVLMGISLMKIFKKAGRQDAWAAWVPIYNQYVYFEVAGRPGWWAFLAFIPFVGSIAALITGVLGAIDISKSFGKSSGFTVLLVLLPLIAFPMLAFGNATYSGPAGPEGHKGAAPTPPQAPTPTPAA